jgi:hypothetical protein
LYIEKVFIVLYGKRHVSFRVVANRSEGDLSGGRVPRRSSESEVRGYDTARFGFGCFGCSGAFVFQEIETISGDDRDVANDD